MKPSKQQTQLQKLRSELNAAFLERSHIIDGLLASLLVGGNAVLYGPPGTAKSELLKAMCSGIAQARYFKRLLQKAMPPEELLGPISLKSLEKDELRRNTNRRLPEAHIAFLDEVFKCNATTLNALLGLLNEREFENPDPQPVPLIFLCGAANRVPEEVELAPFVDRFIFRPWVPYLQSEKNKALLTEWACDGTQPQVSADQLTLKDIQTLKAEALATPVSVAMRSEYQKALGYLTQEGFAVSDRRRMQLIKLLKCFAYVQGDGRVCIEHLHELLPFCLWTKESSEIPLIKKAIDAACPLPKKHLKTLLKTASEETQSALRMQGDSLKGALERATQQLVNIEKTIHALQNSETSTLPETEYEKVLGEIGDLREELAEAKDLAIY